MTWRQSNNSWSGGIASHSAPQKFRVQKSAGKVLASIFWGSRLHPRHWLSSKGPNYKHGVLLISAGAVEGHFEGKTPQEGQQGDLVLAWQCTGSPGTCSPEETGLPMLPMSWSPILFSGSGPVGLPTVPWTEKKQLRVRHFSSDTEVIVATKTRLDGQHSEFFEWLAKVRAKG